jgi:DNA-binding CsgD family transcriptional regulator
MSMRSADLLPEQCKGKIMLMHNANFNKDRITGLASLADMKKSNTLEHLAENLSTLNSSGLIGQGMLEICDYVGATHYLLARYDLANEPGLDFVISSNWPFDLVRRLGGELLSTYARTTELEKCLSVLQPSFSMLPTDVVVPEGLSQQYCSLTFNAGRTRLCLLLLFPDDYVLSPDRLREVCIMTGYYVGTGSARDIRNDRDFDLTERELECLYWIAEGKTSDEMAMILGISRNTINNYITSVMRKTATKTRSEAIAFAVRHNLV